MPRNALTNTEDRLTAVAEDLYKHNYVRFVAFVAYPTSPGQVRTMMFDVNNIFGTNGKTMEECISGTDIAGTRFRDLFDDFTTLMYSDKPEADTPSMVIRKGRGRASKGKTIKLALDPSGYPILPNPSAATLPNGETAIVPYHQALVRTFANMVYRKSNDSN